MNDTKTQIRGGVKRILQATAALSLVGSAGVLWGWRPWKSPPPVSAQQLAARLDLAAGAVTLEADQGGGEPRTLVSGTPLPEGARIATGAGARALVTLGDGTRIYLDEDTRVDLAEGLRLLAGRVWLHAPELSDAEAPAQHRVGEVTVALSAGGASLEHRDGVLGVYVAEGLASVSGAAGRTEVAAGERVRMAPGEALTVEPVAFWEDWTGGMGDRSGSGFRDAGAAGSLYAVDRQGPAGAPALPLQIQSQNVKVVIRDDLAETMVEQRFFNPASHDVEGYFWFTVPEHSQLVSFALETNGQLVEGEVVERHRAASTYEAAVQAANDPALLEWIDERTVRARIFPVPGLGSRRIVVRYQQLLTEAEGKVRYSYPLAAPAGKQTASIEEFSLTVDLGDWGKQFAVSTLAEARVEEGGTRVTMRRSGYRPRADFQLELARKPGTKPPPLRVALLEPGGDQARFAMVRLAPDLAFDRTAVPHAQVVVVVDTSAAGDASEAQARLAVAEALLRSLSAGDKFAVMAADVRATALYPTQGLAEAGPDTVSAALERLAMHRTGGATDLGEIFEPALARVHGEVQPAVVYIGDGLATSGEQGAQALSERLRRSLASSPARLFAVGVGQEVDERLLEHLARVGGGASLRVQVAEEAVVRALELSGALKTPTLTELEIDLGAGLDDVFVNAHGKLSRGQELVLLARTHHDLPKKVEVRGRLLGEAFRETYELVHDTGVLAQAVPRFWAGAYIERLLGDDRGPDAVRGKILSLGLEYGLMSPYTSLLALDSEQAYAASGIGRRTRRFGGVRLTADASTMLERPGRVFEPDFTGGRAPSGVGEGILAALTAPWGCDAKVGSAPDFGAADHKAESSEVRIGRPAAASAPASAQVRTEPQPEPEPEPSPSVAAAPAEEESPAGDPVGAGEEGRMGKPAADVSAPSERASRGKPTSNAEVAMEPTAGKFDAAKTHESTARRVVRRRPVHPCSDGSMRALSQRRALWRDRLAMASSMSDMVAVYDASAASCELPNWRDERTFLKLLSARVQTETDATVLLTHFADEPDARSYLARALLRRLADPSLVAAVNTALFGTRVDWADVDRRVLLAASVDAKVEVLQAALARAPGDPQGELRLIKLLAQSGRSEQASAVGRGLREQGFMTPQLAQALGEALLALGDVDGAQRLFSEIVEFDPEGSDSRRLLGDIFLRHGWFDQAYRQYEDLLGLTPEDSSAAIRLARAAAGAGRVDEALRILRKIAAGEGRPGADDPRRFARLHGAAELALLFVGAKDSDAVSAASLTRELRRLQLFDAPGNWTLLLWDDLAANLVLAAPDPAGATPLGETAVSSATGLFALHTQPNAEVTGVVRHAGELMDRPVGFVRVTIAYDGAKFEVTTSKGVVAARELGAGEDGTQG